MDLIPRELHTTKTDRDRADHLVGDANPGRINGLLAEWYDAPTLGAMLPADNMLLLAVLVARTILASDRNPMDEMHVFMSITARMVKAEEAREVAERDPEQPAP